MTPRLAVFVFQSVLPFAYASSFRLLLLRLCSNRCAEAIVAYRNSLLKRLNIVHGSKILTIIIMFQCVSVGDNTRACVPQFI